VRIEVDREHGGGSYSALMARAFRQVDVFTTEPYRGNPVAVVHDADGLDEETMRRVANWTNLSETTFLLRPEDPSADYRVRIFTPSVELPFAGHPTLGTCHAWLEGGGSPKADTVVQECAAGLVRVRRGDGMLAFAAPPQVRSGPVEPELVERIEALLGVPLVDTQWIDNGPGWVGALLADAETVLSVTPGAVDFDLGIVGPYPEGSECAFELRAFAGTVEDPVTGSLNASVAQWLLGTGRASAPYVASQGTVLGRSGRVHVSRDDDGTIWVGGGTVTCVEGEVLL
jgi:PhzF family phenazine biosynthesis protein